MTAFAGPYLIVCTMLGVGGVAKIIAPLPARRALRALGVPVPIAAVRSLGVAELALACVAGFRGGTVLPMLVGVAYVAFALFVVQILRSGEGISCGCFGSSATPPSWLHVTVNLVSAAVAFAAVGIDSTATVLDQQPAIGIPLLSLVAIGTYGLFNLLTVLPMLSAPPAPVVREFGMNEGTS